MEKHPDPFDKSIREAMKGHGLTPGEEARKAFLEEASTIVSPGRRWKYWYFIPVLVVVLTGLVAVLVFDRNDDSRQPAVGSRQSAIGSQESELDNQHLLTSDQRPTTNDQRPTTDDQRPATNDRQPTTDDQRPTTNDQRPTTNDQRPTNSDQQPPTADQRPTTADQRPTTADQQPTTADQQPPTDDQQPPTADQQPPTDDQRPATSDQQPPTADQQPPTETNWHYAVGGYYLPELMFNTLEGEKWVHNTGVDAVFYHGLVSIRTGLGVSVSKGITRNEIEYNSYLGSYNKLDSVSFTYNESIHNFETEVYTSSQKVWDSNVAADSNEVVKRYTYLQVPLVLGFDFWQKGKLSVGVRVGTIMSVLLKYKQLSGEYDPGENMVIDINQLTPSQVSLNWQAVGGFAASAALTKNLYLELEPQAKYYYGSIYEKSGDVKKPWSIGLRVAAVYKFKVQSSKFKVQD